MKLSVLMPVYNERRTVREIVLKVLSREINGIDSLEIIAVDDCSTDGTREILKQLQKDYPERMRVILMEKNQGKGMAVKTAIQAAEGDIGIIQDADLEYDPADYGALLKPILSGYADVVYGSRFAARYERRVLYFRHTVANKSLTFLSNLCTDLNLTDMETCYKAFSMGIAKTIPIRSKRFGIEPELTSKFAKRKLRIYEVPVSYHGRTYAEGKKITWRDGLKAVWVIIKYRLIDDMFQGSDSQKNLIDMEAAPKYTEWTLQKARPYTGQKVLEIGAGIGNNLRILMQYCDVTAAEINPVYLDILKRSFINAPYVEIISWDALTALPENFRGKYDSVLCSNVLEHIKDDRKMLVNALSALKPGGNIIIIVPRGRRIFGTLDSAIGHVRRYDEKCLDELLRASGFKSEKMFTLNKFGVIGWWWRGKITRRASIGRIYLKLYNVLVPVLKLIDPLVPWKGLSLAAIASADEHKY